MIPSSITIKNGSLPDNSGVYFYYDVEGELLYVGKATSLKKRVGSYFRPPVTPFNSPYQPSLKLRLIRRSFSEGGKRGRIDEMVSKIARIDYIETPTVIEALVLEANQIKAYRPPFNILLRDDKSFLYLTITNEKYPRPLLMRGLELERLGVDPFKKFPPPARGGARGGGRGRQKFLAVYGPYTSGSSLRKALDLVRKFIPWSDCSPPVTPSHSPRQPSLKLRLIRRSFSEGGKRGRKTRALLLKGGSRGLRGRPCFNVHLGKCPGVCTGTISSGEYRKIIRKLMLFFDGKKSRLAAQIKKEMTAAAKAERFEEAAKLRNHLYALDHIRDVALISREDVELPYVRETREGMIDLDGRIEAYDISNISGTSAVGSMVVFEEGKPAKEKYRKFKIKTIRGSNDVAMLEEVMRRRLRRIRRQSPDVPLGKGDTAVSPPARGGIKGGGSIWELPEIMVIDGGEGQVNRVRRVLRDLGVRVPIIGIAKGFDRKQDRLVFDQNDVELARVANRGKEFFQRARDEAHRFAVAYHRKLRDKRSLGKGV